MRLPAPLPRRVVASGVAAALLGGAGVGVTFWPGNDAEPITRAADDTIRDGALSAAALQAAADRREQQRTARASRSAARSEVPTVRAAVARRWATSDVNVRSGPSADDRRIGTVDAGKRVGVTGLTWGGWTQVVAGKRTGWVKSSYLSKKKPEAPVSAAGISGAACGISPDIEAHLSSNARAVYRAVCAAFGGSVSSFGGYRAGDGGDHGSGRALDIMVSGEPGWEIARYVQANAAKLGVTYVIYEQKIWMVGDPLSQWKVMEDRGSSTANHYDHVHVSVR